MHLFRTDLAVESAAPFRDRLPDGVSCSEREQEGIRVTAVEITSQQAAKQLGKPVGRYVTVGMPPIGGPVNPADEVTHLLAEELRRMLPPEGMVLVVGLGNAQITPDALGPLTVRQILATRHIPAQLAEQTGLSGLRPVAAIAPGVLGQTGIETGEIILSIVRDLSPAAVVAVDALAAGSPERVITNRERSI